MQVASLENCKRLYELSKWAETDKGYSKYPAPEPLKYHYKLENGCRKRGAVPAYDLGYLLRKLPQETQIVKGHFTFAELSKKHDVRYHAHYIHREAGQKPHYYTESSDTPEDAACLLLIKLLDEGIINAGN